MDVYSHELSVLFLCRLCIKHIIALGAVLVVLNNLSLITTALVSEATTELHLKNLALWNPKPLEALKLAETCRCVEDSGRPC